MKNTDDVRALLLHIDGGGKETYDSLLRRCGHARDLSRGACVHAHMVSAGHSPHNPLLLMYSKCQALDTCRSLLHALRPQNPQTWNATIIAHAQSGHLAEALILFRQMRFTSLPPSRAAIISLLDSCSSLRSLDKGKSVHKNLIPVAGLASDVVVQTALLNMYGKCGSIEDARAVFDAIGKKDAVAWTAMISVYARNGHPVDALSLFARMNREEGIALDAIAFLSSLDACSELASLECGRAIHELAIMKGFGSEILIQNALIHMYMKCRCLRDARAVFDCMQTRDVISFTSMIAAYASNGYSKEALEVYREMGLAGIKPNRITFLAILNACTTLASLELSKAIHKTISANGLDSDPSITIALINLYGKCGSLSDAESLFKMAKKRDIVLYTSMIAVYAQTGHNLEALTAFLEMDQKGLKPDRVAFLTILEACTNLASLKNGRLIHERVMASQFRSDISVNTAILNMYSRCGNLSEALRVFDGMHCRNPVSWNAMVAAYSHHGCSREACHLFEQMGFEGVQFDRVTFISVLSACSHAAFLDEGVYHFVSMSKDHGITPLVEHFVCLVDLLGRAGCVDEADDVLKNMPIQTDPVALNALLGGR